MSVDVTNTGQYDGEETIQLYIRDVIASVTRPVKELKGFKKIFLRKERPVLLDSNCVRRICLFLVRIWSLLLNPENLFL